MFHVERFALFIVCYFALSAAACILIIVLATILYWIARVLRSDPKRKPTHSPSYSTSVSADSVVASTGTA